MNKKGFSLIELSMVLIIISLLIYGVLGAQSLIENAKIRGLANEFSQLRQQIHSFYALKGRMPGDLNNDGLFGQSGCGSSIVVETYTSNDFPAPYDGSDDAYGIPTAITAPFVELYLEKISSFKPKKVSYGLTQWRDTARDGGLPISKIIRNYVYMPVYRNDACTSAITQKNDELHYLHNFRDGIYFDFQYWINGKYMRAKIAEKVDKKLDDGKYNAGIIRGHCQATGQTNGKVAYQASEESGSAGGCRWLSIFMGIN